MAGASPAKRGLSAQPANFAKDPLLTTAQTLKKILYPLIKASILGKWSKGSTNCSDWPTWFQPRPHRTEWPVTQWSPLTSIGFFISPSHLLSSWILKYLLSTSRLHAFVFLCHISRSQRGCHRSCQVQADWTDALMPQSAGSPPAPATPSSMAISFSS